MVALRHLNSLAIHRMLLLDHDFFNHFRLGHFTWLDCTQNVDVLFLEFKSLSFLLAELNMTVISLFVEFS